MTNGKIKYKKNHKIITPPQCLSRTRVNKVKIIHEFKKCLQNIQNIKIKCLKINKNKHHIKSIIISHGCIILIITAGQMMVLETLLDVQLALLHMEVNRVNLLLHSRNSQLHRAHAPL